MIRIVLVGNQNCGKTTLFNALTGLDQHTGNWPGVTVTRISGTLRGVNGAELVDLPGTYSLHPYTEEERVTRNVLYEGEYNAIINVVDATCLERGLYLTFQLKRLGRPVILALNMMDEVRKQGSRISSASLTNLLEIPVIPVTARTGEGLSNLIERTLQAASHQVSQSLIVPLPIPNADEIDASYRKIGGILAQTVVSGRRTRAGIETVDRLLLQTPLGVPTLLLMLLGVMWLAFGPIASCAGRLLEHLIERACVGAMSLMQRFSVSPWLQDFVTNGLLAGIGSVLSFLPTVLLLLTGLALLEDSGLMARAVYLLDRYLRRFGLSGRAFIPLFLGFGCTVPAAMAVRSMSDIRERTLTLLLLPFMSCGAKLPVYALFAQAFFGQKGWMATAAMYLAGVLLSMAAALVYSVISGKDNPSPLLMELPVYRLPTLRSVLRGISNRAGEFVRRTFSVILLATIAVWVLQHFSFQMTWTDDLSASMLGRLAGVFSPLFTPLGFGTQQAVASLMTGLLAKESIISTLTILGGPSGVLSVFATAASVLSFMTFVLLYPPCVAAMSAMAQAFGRKRYAVYTASVQFLIAWCTSFLVYILTMHV